MCAGWEQLRRGLVSSLTTEAATARFQEMKDTHADVRRFEDPLALVRYLHDGGGSLDDKDALYADLVRIVQGQGPEADVAQCLLWLGLWPALDGIIRRRGRAASAIEELASAIGEHFTRQLRTLDLGQVRRVAATLARNTAREVFRSAERSRLHDERFVATPVEHERPSARSALGFPGGLPAEVEVELLERRLRALEGEDACLLVARVIAGENLRVLGERLGVSHQAASKRYQRAVGRIRRQLRP